MANVMFKKGLLAGLPSTYAEGTFYVTTDERAIYLDVSDSARIRLGDFQEFATLEALKANVNPSTSALYYISGLNVLAKWNGTDYVQINLDTGATSVEVVGSGNAVTAAAYDAATRKLTLTMGETFAKKSELDELDAFVGDIPEGYTEETVIAYINKKAEETLNAASGGSSESAASVLAALNTYKSTTDPRLEALEAVDHEHANKAELDKIADGDKAKWDAMEQNAKDYADSLAGNYDATGAADAVDEKLTTEVNRAKAAEETNAAAAAAALAEAQAKVASVAAGDNSVTVGGTTTAPTVAAKISQDADNALALAEDGLKVVIPAAAEYSIVKAADSGDYAAVYNLTKGGEIVGASINIPKDMVVKSGSVVDGNIVLVLNDEANTEIVIPADSLIEYVTSGSQTGDMVVIAVSDDHKVTASITDGSITLAKLATDVQTAIGKAHSHENASVLAGITEQKVADWDDAVAKEHEHANKDVIDGITAEKVTAWDGAQAAAEATAAAALGAAKTELEGKIADAQAAAEEKATDFNTAMDTRMQVVEGKAHEHANKTELDKIAEGDVAKWNAAEQNAKDYADGLAGNYDASGAAAAVQGETDKTVKDVVDILTWGSF